MRLTDLRAEIDAHSYPTTTAALIEAFGERELELPNGNETVGEALGRLGNETLRTPEEARLSAYSAVSRKAIGRENYSDRDAPAIGEEGHDQESL